MSSFVVNAPLVLGHEVSALVAEVGENVKHLKPGDRVAIEPAIPCRTCTRCKEGMYNHCPVSNAQVRGSPTFDGMLRRYFAHPADFCYKSVIIKF
jgi:threonine dehydrogenase-like Zn-dependent dehydrogenase